MLDEIGSIENARPWLEHAVATKKKIMGMGHRVYKVKDPRATVLQELAENAFAESSRPAKYELAMEAGAHRRRHPGAEGHLSQRRFLLGHRLPSRWASRPTCSRRSSPSPASPAGWPTGWSS